MGKQMDDGRELRQAVAGLARRRRTEAVPRPIRSRVIEYVRRGRKRGRSWRELAHSVGLAPYTVQRWVRLADETGPAVRKLVPVRIEPEGRAGSGGLVLVMPTGVRLEGLAAEDAVAVLRGLQ